ncbi:ABC transporter permease [Paenibacillus agri]|uniref:Iron ABC transporter permease n=1 Tax=Paenibacillus agri TaxID=2744309 RepID=A0A850EPR2_9BACL|nr:iron ABC transporter permease [Paenibacillus agri]NUU61274.1 iron ABC transporter permease [Paenibacillus agri]
MKKSSVRTFPWRGGSLALGILAILVLLPLLLIFWTSISPGGRLDIGAPLKTIVNNRGLLEVLLNSLGLGVSVIALTTIFALPLAWIMAKTSIGRHRWLDVVLLIPFMTPPYIGSMGWMLFMQSGGYMEQLLPASAAVTPYFFSYWGMVLIMSLHLFPFLYLLLRNSLLQIGGSLEEAAAVHGASFAYKSRKVILPLLLSSYGLGALLIFVKTIAEFGTPATFGRKIGFYVLTSEIHRYIASWPIDFGKATSLASVLLGVCLVMWYIQTLISSRYSYRLVGGKGMRSKSKTSGGLAGLASWGYLVFLLIASIGVPYFSIITASLLKLRGEGLSWGNLTLNHYWELLSPGSPGMHALINSLGLAVAASCIAVILGTWFGLTIGKASSWRQKLTDLFSLLPNTVPGIVLVVGLILFWNARWMPIPLYNTYGMVVLTYVVLFLPYTVQYVKSSYGQLDPALMQAGQVFGGSRIYVFRRILLPLILPGMAAGWMMTFTISNRELVASLLILPPSMQTSATYIFAQFEQGAVPLGMAMAVVSVGITTALLLAIEYLNPDRKRRQR